MSTHPSVFNILYLVKKLNSIINPPLAVHFIWNNADLSDFNDVCGSFRKYLTRDIARPFSRELNIPTFFYSSSDDVPKNSPLSVAQKNIIFVCLSRNTLVSKKWRKYLNSLPSNSSNCIIPIALDEYALKHSGEEGALKNLNFVRAFEFDEQIKEKLSILSLSHELFRFGFHETQENILGKDSSIQLFLSHAKKGGTGEIYARAIKRYIDGTNMRNFFDASEISVGYKFDEEIKNHIHKSTLISITTDEYSSRYWCQREILEAKKEDRPIISVNCLQIYEDRIFPPSGNVPCVHITPNAIPLEEEVLNILIAALLETIRFRYSKALLEYYKNQDWIDSSAVVLARPPEIQQIVHLKEKIGIDRELKICYPEPPIYAEEMDWVNFLKVKVFTPLWSNTETRKKRFRVGVSISDYEETDFKELHTHPDELKRFAQELARHLLVANNILIYGGDLRAHGFTKFILEEASILKNRLPEQGFSVENHLAWPFHYLPESLDYQADYFDVLNQVNYDLPSEFDGEIDPSSWLEIKTLQDRYIVSKSLSNMRLESIKNSDIRIFAGGKTKKYLGVMPGVLEEFYTAVTLEKPIYLVGGFGGVVKNICDSILSKNISEIITQEGQEACDSEYQSFMEFLNEKTNTLSYQAIHSKILTLTVDDLAQASGLSLEDYSRLMVSPLIDEVIHLILKGLNNLDKQ
ncbi:TIR domain-containing protein [Acinetobacter ursingii]|uniref:TIR domain-containing protein n=3 Tax=Acinetobacter ursingii TaxID=108980 RepID=UPI00209150F3|nr:TIR domain-containing protein [Acinetobacter ursingii]